MNKMMRAAAALGILLAAGFTCFGGTDELDGTELLKIVKEAQAANKDRHPHGKMEFLYIVRQKDRGEKWDISKVRMEWDGESEWCDLERWLRRDQRPALDETPDEKAQYILHNGKIHAYHASAQKLFIEGAVWGNLPEELRLRPVPGWYSPLTLSQARLTWDRILDPASVPETKSSVFDFVTRSNGPSLFEVTRRDVNTGGSATMVFSLALEGNVVSYAVDEPISTYHADGTCVWEAAPNGGLFLKEHKLVRSFKAGEGMTVMEHAYETLSHDPTHRPAKTRFDLKSLSMPGGVLVEDRVSGRRWRTGDSNVNAMESQLNDLKEHMKRRGFSQGK